ncbi:MAG: hypothetical protein U0W24_21950 [Bacteroidales bacterium]
MLENIIFAHEIFFWGISSVGYPPDKSHSGRERPDGNQEGQRFPARPGLSGWDSSILHVENQSLTN